MLHTKITLFLTFTENVELACFNRCLQNEWFDFEVGVFALLELNELIKSPTLLLLRVTVQYVRILVGNMKNKN